MESCIPFLLKTALTNATNPKRVGKLRVRRRNVGARLFGFSASAGGANVVEGDGASAKEDEAKGQRGERQREFVSPVTQQSVMEVYFCDSHRQIDADGKSGAAGEQPEEHEEAAKELGKGGEIGHPGRESKAGDELNVVVKSTEDFLISVGDHHGAEGQAHDEQSERLQAIEVAQMVPPAERGIDYSKRGDRRKPEERQVRRGPLDQAQNLTSNDCAGWPTSGNVLSPQDAGRGRRLVTRGSRVLWVFPRALEIKFQSRARNWQTPCLW